jgi:hypothetical protein
MKKYIVSKTPMKKKPSTKTISRKSKGIKKGRKTRQSRKLKQKTKKSGPK